MSLLDKSRTIYQQFKQVKTQIENINDLYGTAKELDELTGEDARFTQAAYDLLDSVKEFVSKIEDTDTNLDPELTKLEGVDSLFKGHFVTDHMNNVFNEVYNSQGVCSKAPCKAEDENCCKNEVKSAILRATDPVKPFVRPNPTCKLVCTRNHCSCEDGW